jgi:hypothetical protein
VWDATGQELASYLGYWQASAGEAQWLVTADYFADEGTSQRRLWQVGVEEEIPYTGGWLGFRPAAPHFLTGIAQGVLQVRELTTRQVLRSFRGGAPVVSADGQLAALPTGTHTVIRNLVTGRQVARLPGALPQFSPDGNHLALYAAGQTQVWKLTTRQEQGTFVGRPYQFAPSGEHIATFLPHYFYQSVYMWQVATSQELPFAGRWETFMPGEAGFVTIDDYRLRLWDGHSDQESASFELLPVARDENCFIDYAVQFNQSGSSAMITAYVTQCQASGGGTRATSLPPASTVLTTTKTIVQQ